MPPVFATQTPLVFDGRLPKLSEEDVEYIANTFPELAKDVPNYDMETIVKFFKQRLAFAHYLVSIVKCPSSLNF